MLRETSRRTWQNCLYTVNGSGEVQEIWSHLDYLCVGSEGPGPHRVRISPYDPERRIWLVNETFHQIYVFSNDGVNCSLHMERRKYWVMMKLTLDARKMLLFFPTVES